MEAKLAPASSEHDQVLWMRHISTALIQKVLPLGPCMVSRRGAGDLRNHYQVLPTVSTFSFAQNLQTAFEMGPQFLYLAKALPDGMIHFPFSLKRSLPLLTNSSLPVPHVGSTCRASSSKKHWLHNSGGTTHTVHSADGIVPLCWCKSSQV